MPIKASFFLRNAVEVNYTKEAIKTGGIDKNKKFYFGQYWQVYGTNSIEVPEDFTVEQAIEYVKKTWDDVGLAQESSYVSGSDEPDFENCSFGND